RAAVPALVGGEPAPRWLAGRGSRLGALLALAALIAPAAALTAAAGLVPWVFWYMFTGLAAPALVIDRLGPVGALGRPFRLDARGGPGPRAEPGAAARRATRPHSHGRLSGWGAGGTSSSRASTTPSGSG